MYRLVGKAVSSLKAKFHISWTFFLNVPFLFLTERLISLRVLLTVACFCPTISHSNFQVIVPPSSLLMPSDYTNNYILLVCSLTTSVSIKPSSTSQFLENVGAWYTNAFSNTIIKIFGKSNFHEDDLSIILAS